MERYEAYKDSGVEWIGEIPEGWEVWPLKQLISCYKAGPFGSSLITSALEPEGEFLVYTPEHVALNTTTSGKNLYLPSSRISEMLQFSVSVGDVVFPIVGTLGRAMTIRPEMPSGIINQRLAKFRLLGENLDLGFFMWLFGRSDFYAPYIELEQRGSFIVNLTKQIVGSMPVPLPSVSEQMTIADYLDAKTAEIDALVGDCEREVELLQEYRKAVISEAVTKGLDPDAPMKESGIEWIGEIPASWAIVPFKAIGTVAANLQHPADYLDLPQVSPDRIEKDSGRLLPCISVADVGVESDNHLFHAGDILYSKVRPALNKVTVAPFDGMCSADMYPIVSAQNRRWLVYFMLSNAFMEQVIVSTDRVKMPKINKEELGAFKVVLPGVDDQSEIVDYLSAKTAEIDSLIDAKQSMADKLREYRRSLISEAVTGKFKAPGVE